MLVGKSPLDLPLLMLKGDAILTDKFLLFEKACPERSRREGSEEIWAKSDIYFLSSAITERDAEWIGTVASRSE